MSITGSIRVTTEEAIKEAKNSVFENKQRLRSFYTCKQEKTMLLLMYYTQREAMEGCRSVIHWEEMI